MLAYSYLYARCARVDDGRDEGKVEVAWTDISTARGSYAAVNAGI